jgi:hypothetical protein
MLHRGDQITDVAVGAVVSPSVVVMTGDVGAVGVVVDRLRWRLPDTAWKDHVHLGGAYA